MSRPTLPISEILEPVSMLRQNEREALKTRQVATSHGVSTAELLRKSIAFMISNPDIAKFVLNK